MKLATFEGVVDSGTIRLPAHVDLPDKTRVHVVVSEADGRRRARLLSPRLVHKEQASDFEKEVLEAPSNASL